MQHKKRLGTIALLASTALVGGVLFGTGPANAVRDSAKSVWNQVRPQADKRYVKKTDQNKIIRTASAAPGAAIALSGSSQTILTTKLKAPSKGYLVVSAQELYQVGSATPLVHCGISVDGSDWASSWSRASDGIETTSGHTTCSLVPTIAVNKGSHTIAYQAHNDGGGSVSSEGGQLSVTFVPYNGSGHLPGKIPAKIPARSGHRDVNR